jgi:hypothetical protein
MIRYREDKGSEKRYVGKGKIDKEREGWGKKR